MWQQNDDLNPDPYESPVRNQLYERLAPAPSPAPAPSQAPALSPSPAPASFNYEAARDSWMSGQYGKDEAGAAQWASQYGIPYSGGDVINLPNGGGLIDILGNFKSGVNVANNWTPAGGNGPNPNGAGGVAGAGAGAAGAGAGGDFQSQIRALLLQQLGKLGQPVTETDPAIAGQLQSQDRSIERNRQARRAAMAERAAFTGLNSGGAGSGAMDADIASGFEDAGQQKSDVRSRLFASELGQRRSQLGQLLGMAMQSGDADAARALQLQIAQMDNELRRLGLSQSQSQWNDQFGRLLGRDREDDFRYRSDFGF